MKMLIVMLLAGLVVLPGCDDGDKETAPEQRLDPELLDALRTTVDEQNLTPITAPPEQDPAKVELGHNLFFDPILSGERNISCATCHQMEQATADEFPLSAGPRFRFDDYGDRVPGTEHGLTIRTSPPVFNRGHDALQTMFWDSRLEELPDGRIVIHERSYPKMEGHYFRVMPDEFDNILAAQASMPVHERDEMRGIAGEPDIFGEPNELAGVAGHQLEGTWNRLMDRLVAIDEYRRLLEAAYPQKDVDDLEFAHAANGIGAFQIEHFSFQDSPWDRFLAGDDHALTDAQARGAKLFYGDAGCADCHGGELLTDQQLYNIGVPPMTTGPEPLDNMDLGAAHLSHAGPDEEFFFRTPPLHNVALTGSYMHNGAFESLEDVIRHKIDPVDSLWNFDASHLGPAFRQQVHTGEEQLARVEKSISPEALRTPGLDDGQIDDLVAFLHALTSPGATDLTDLVPETVPSELPLNFPVAEK